ncbi:MAG TPA: helical backbone metal receptor [Burkholderiaceae bacterium]|nr:helical backbone metal receptor [Burkholderiaceae bacterium]
MRPPLLSLWSGRGGPVLGALLAALVGSAALAQTPKRIIALSPSLTESVCALGRCPQLVAVDRYSDWPATPTASLPRVGGLEDAQIERIVALKPDLVLLGPRSRAGERLQSLGVHVLTLDARTHADLKRTLLQLGKALGQSDQAHALLQRIDATLQAAAARVPASWRDRTVYLEVTPGVAAGASSFIGETLSRLGLRSIAGPELGLFPRLNPEQVVRHPPDVVIGPRGSLADASTRPGWATLPALRQGRVCLLDSTRMDLLLRPGPRVGEAAQMLVDCLLTLPPPAPEH